MRERDLTGRLYAAFILAYLLLAAMLAWVYPATDASRNVAIALAALAVIALAARVILGFALRKTALPGYSCPTCQYVATLRDIERGQPLPCNKCGRTVYIDR